MSIIEAAKYELDHTEFDESEKATYIKILEIFLDEFDSGGAVHCAIPILMRLICGKPLGPLTGRDTEWMDIGHGTWQNRRCGSVFKTDIDIPHRGLKAGNAYDIDTPFDTQGHFTPIIFPYIPATPSNAPSPVIEI
jgi:hypothetical protein